MKIKIKKAELTTQKIVFLIILITSFAIILFLLFRLNLGETSNKEICRNSVVLKSKGGVFTGKLDCKVNYMCISGGGKCEDINPTSTVKVDLNNKKEIIKAIADEMADCWWMFGEGKLDYLGFTEKGIIDRTTCAICSIIMFDNKILDQEYKISYREFYEYLNNLSKSETETYFAYLYNSYDVEKFQKEVSHLEIDLDDFILEDERYVIVTGFKKGFKVEQIGDIFTPIREAYMYPYYVKSNEIVSKLGCDEFITKA